MSLLTACPAAQLSHVEVDGTGDDDDDDDDDDTSGSSDSGTGDETGGDGDGDDDGTLATSTGDDDGTTTTASGAPTPDCGDGVVDPGEGCDDGNHRDDDACTAACQPAACGDGLVHIGEEVCDDGNTVDDDSCTNACTDPECGDGIRQRDEACDDGNDVADDDCTNACTTPRCGDGIVQHGESCDDGGESPTCDADCSPAACGDGEANAAAGEACDDGKASAGCDVDCSLAECGDGEVSPLAGEVCDDGNTLDGDFCSSACKKAKRLVFVSSELYNGNLGGLGGADAKCQALAAAAGLQGKFLAWLSAGVANPGNRFIKSDVPYVLTNGTQVAKNWADLTDGTLQHAIDTTEQMTVAPIPSDGCGGGSKPTVWTNTLESGAGWDSNACNAWTGIGGFARMGHAKAINFTWSRYCEGMANSCSWHAAIYCFEQ
jgi:cysteine-rich repeat protein